MSLPMAVHVPWILVVAAVGCIIPSAAQADIVSKWRSYGGDEALAASASLMVFCSCDLRVGRCNITMAAQFYPQYDAPECHTVCGGEVECAYCRQPVCACSPIEVQSYRLCQSGNRAKLFQCSDTACTSIDAMPLCACEMIILQPERTTESPSTVRPPSTRTVNTPSNNSAFNHGLLTGLAVGGCILLLLVLIVMALIFVALRKRTIARSPVTRTNTSSSAAPLTLEDGFKGINNPTYANGSKRVPAAPPSSNSYLYPYAPRLTVNRQLSASDRSTASNSASSPPTDTQASHHYQELIPREGDQPPTYEDSEGYIRHLSNADTRNSRRQPVYMELVRPSDRTLRPPVDTYMY